MDRNGLRKLVEASALRRTVKIRIDAEVTARAAQEAFDQSKERQTKQAAEIIKSNARRYAKAKVESVGVKVDTQDERYRNSDTFFIQPDARTLACFKATQQGPILRDKAITDVLVKRDEVLAVIAIEEHAIRVNKVVQAYIKTERG